MANSAAMDKAGLSSYVSSMAIHRLGIPAGAVTDGTPIQRQATVAELNERAREVLRLVVESYVETGEPVGGVVVGTVPELDEEEAGVVAEALDTQMPLFAE